MVAPFGWQRFGFVRRRCGCCWLICSSFAGGLLCRTCGLLRCSFCSPTATWWLRWSLNTRKPTLEKTRQQELPRKLPKILRKFSSRKCMFVFLFVLVCWSLVFLNRNIYWCYFLSVFVHWVIGLKCSFPCVIFRFFLLFPYINRKFIKKKDSSKRKKQMKKKLKNWKRLAFTIKIVE